MRTKGKIFPTEGGCWFCWHADGDLAFDTEFDTYVHIDCIKRTLEDEPNHPEAEIMAYLIAALDAEQTEGETE